MRNALAVLGGSGPFTIALVDALAEASTSIPPKRLVLQGRNLHNARLVQRYAQHRLEPAGWSVDVETELGRAIDGARLIVHQYRYGGTEGRCEDEEVALRFGIEPDETLGPAALHRFLRTLPALRETASALAAHPHAWVLNLTNPLSLTTSVLSGAGVRCVGLCELPLVTARQAAERLGRPLETIDWDYAGLNHRGFIVKFRAGSVDLIPELADGEIATLEAIPTKYFRLLTGRQARGGGRAAEVARVRERALRELEEDPLRVPPSLRERPMEWYREIVVPVIVALCEARGSDHVVNVTGPDGLTREIHAVVSRDGVRPRPIAEPAPGIAHYLAAFEAHERALLDWVREPSRVALSRAVELDPLVPPEKAESVTEYLMA